MNTILVPIDFSETANNATNYAAKLAHYTKSKILLFHVYHVPIIVTEVPFVWTAEEFKLEEDKNKQMKQVVESLQKKYENNLEIESVLLQGFTSDEIVGIAKDRNCDLIVMGTNGADGSNKIFGSNTFDVIKHTQSHVLVIPDKIKFQKIDKIVFAYDYKPIENNFVFKPLTELATLFNTEILIFNLEDSRIHPSKEKSEQGVMIDHVFENIKHTYWFSEHENILEAINKFAEDNHAVMVSMIRRNHSLFQKIVTKSNTKLMALNSHLPLLVLHE